MRARVSRLSRGSWRTVDILSTEPLQVRLPPLMADAWIDSLPTVPLKGEAVSLRGNPEGWIRRMAESRHTRLRVEILRGIPSRSYASP